MSAFQSLTSVTPNGLTNAARGQTMGAAGTPDPTWAILYANDFLRGGDIADFAVVQNGAATGTLALGTGDGGVALLTTSAGAADQTVAKLSSLAYLYTPAKFMFFKGKFTIPAAMNVEAGLANFSAAAVIAQGITIKMVPGAVPTLNLYSGGAIVATVPFQSTQSIVAGTVVEIGIRVDYQGNIAGYFNPTTGSSSGQASVATTTSAKGQSCAIYNSLNGVAQNLSLPTNPMDPFFSAANTSAGAKALSVDFIVASRER